MKNVTKGKSCEMQIMERLWEKYDVCIPIHVGADFACFKGKKGVLIEAKCNKSGLTKSQKRLKRLAENRGFDYKVMRCKC